MDFSVITTIVTNVSVVLVALLALDNAVDAVAKMFGNKKIDTLCGIIALKLADYIAKLKGIPQTSSTATTTVVNAQPQTLPGA